MRTILFTISLIYLIFVGCQKKYIENDWNIDLRVSINAEFTDSNELQTVAIKKNAPIDDPQSAAPINGAKVQIKYNNITYQFNETTPGTYQSAVSFGINNTDDFTVYYQIESRILRDTFAIPAPIEITNITNNQSSNSLSLSAEISGSDEHYFLLEIYDLKIDTNLFGVPDSSWTKNIGLVPFDLAYSAKGTNQVKLIEDNLRYGGTLQGKLIRIELTPITQRVYNYFRQFNEYSENLATLNLYVNAPIYYANLFYGVTYSTNWHTYLVEL
ncbi:MAG: DUF4249 family protein [Crocinitomicaceae bacterium]